MNKLKEQAFILRSQGKSFNEINKKLNIAKSTLSYWFKRDQNSRDLTEDLTKKAHKEAAIRLRSVALRNKARWENLREGYRKEAHAEFARLLNEKSFIAGLAIYWGEGDKGITPHVRVSNVDPKLLRVFVNFLEKCCSVPKNKIRAWILIYPDIEESACKEYWSKNIGLALSQFDKSQLISGRAKRKRLSYGVCAVHICSRKVKEKLIKWIDLLYNYQI